MAEIQRLRDEQEQNIKEIKELRDRVVHFLSQLSKPLEDPAKEYVRELLDKNLPKVIDLKKRIDTKIDHDRKEARD
jgi:hypothetical protein